MKYPKIETLYKRDESFKVDPVQLRLPEFSLVRKWLYTEKIDGTNVRIIRTAEGEMIIRGRTDRADWALRESPLKKKLDSMFNLELLNSVLDIGTEAILYGEGYGAGIQKGGKYRKDKSFRLFDVHIGEWWLNWADVEDIAHRLGILTVPHLGIWERVYFPANKAELMDITGPSSVALYEGGEINSLPEGIVARTEPLLFTRRGDRVMWKIKFKDF